MSHSLEVDLVLKRTLIDCLSCEEVIRLNCPCSEFLVLDLLFERVWLGCTLENLYPLGVFDHLLRNLEYLLQNAQNRSLVYHKTVDRSQD